MKQAISAAVTPFTDDGRREHGYTVARLFVETTRTVNEALCEGTPFIAELLEYDDETGRGVQRFTRRVR